MQEISKAKFMELAGLTRTRYDQDRARGLIPKPLETQGKQFRHFISDVEKYEQNRRKLLKETPENKLYAEELAKMKRVTI